MFAGYLISTLNMNPAVQLYLSKGNEPSTYSFLNKGQLVLKSTAGSKAVRDVFLTTNDARDEWFMSCTDLDVKTPNFSWDRATRSGSGSIVVWRSKNLIDWSSPTLPVVEDPTAGILWAPSAVFDSITSRYHVFWSTQLYSTSDLSHKGTATLKRTRYATTKDFITFTFPRDYLAPSKSAIIDQEFIPLGKPGHFARFYKDESAGSRVVMEKTTDGLFGTWKTVGNVRAEGRREGPAAWKDNKVEGKYYLLLDDYTEYLPFQTTNIVAVSDWQTSSSDSTNPF